MSFSNVINQLHILESTEGRGRISATPFFVYVTNLSPITRTLTGVPTSPSEGDYIIFSSGGQPTAGVPTSFKDFDGTTTLTSLQRDSVFKRVGTNWVRQPEHKFISSAGYSDLSENYFLKFGVQEFGQVIRTPESLYVTYRSSPTAFSSFQLQGNWTILPANSKVRFYEAVVQGAPGPAGPAGSAGTKVSFDTKYPSNPSEGDVFFYTGPGSDIANPELTSGSVFVRVGSNWVKQLVSLSR